MSSSVAENALCWCDGRNARVTRLRNPRLVSLELDADDAIKVRFYMENGAGLRRLSIVIR